MKESERLGVRRVLKMVDNYLSFLPQDTLVAYKGDLKTWSEIRKHVKAADKLMLPSKSRTEKWSSVDKSNTAYVDNKGMLRVLLNSYALKPMKIKIIMQPIKTVSSKTTKTRLHRRTRQNPVSTL